MARSPEPAVAGAAAPGAVRVADPVAVVPGLDIVGELGRGAQAVVYQVRRQGTDFALKLLRPADDDRRAAVAFRREAGMVACVDHPGVAQVHEVGDVGGRPYIVMDLVKGQPLVHLVEEGPLPEEGVIALGIDIAGALAAAHQVGVVHRDVKPHNIVVTDGGQAMLIDFGLATQPAGQVAVDAVAGTVAYAAPEQTGMQKRPVDGRTDLYALGVVLFECLTGKLPFTATDPGELIHLHATAPPPGVLGLQPDASPTLAAIVAKLLAKDPDDRYQTSDGLLADLQRLGRDPHGEAFPLGTQDRVANATRRRLIGRQAELARLTELWRRVQDGRGALAVVDGPLGIGKTRLVEEFLTATSADGAAVLSATCAPGDPVPLAPLRAAVEQYVRGLDQLEYEPRAAAIKRLKAAAGPAASVLGPLSPTLGKLLQAHSIDDEKREEQFTTAVARFLTGLARVEGGVILHIDGASWLDPASQRVLGQVSEDLATAPLMLLCATRTERDGTTTDAEDDRIPDLHLTLEPLADDEVETLAQTRLGGNPLSEALNRQLTTRVRGNAGLLMEYLRAMIEEGVVHPSWGKWALNEAALDGLRLSADVKDLVVRRTDGLTPPARQILTAAAALPIPFFPSLLADICGVDRDAAADAIQEAVSLGIAVTRPGAVHVFLHDLLPEVLLSAVPDDERPALHQKIADALERTGLSGAAVAYALAGQYALGDPNHNPPRMFAACYRAGRLALAGDAVPEAAAYLELAAEAAERADVVPDGGFHRTAGMAALRLGHYVEARRHFAVALGDETDRLERGEILGLIARAYLGEHATTDCVETVKQALAEIGHPLPATRTKIIIGTIKTTVAGIRVGLSSPRRRYGTARGETLERYRLLLRLQFIGAAGASAGMRRPLAVAFLLRSLYPANRAGSVSEYVRLRAALGALAYAVGWRSRGEQMFAATHRLAALFTDPRLSAQVARVHATAEDLGFVVHGRSGTATRRMLEEHGHWLDPDDYLDSAAGLGTVLAVRGYAREALTWYDRGEARITDRADIQGTRFAAVRVLGMIGAGQVAEAAAGLSAMQERDHRDDQQRINHLVVALYSAMEQGDFGPAFDDAAAEVERLLLRPRQAWQPHRILWAYLAFGRVTQARTNLDEARLATAADAVKALRRAAVNPLLRTYYHAAVGSYLPLIGEHRKALWHLALADRLASRLDVPWLTCEIATVRARILASTGDSAESRRQAKIAFLLAAECGRPLRTRAIRTEFDVNVSATQHDRSHTMLHSDTIGGPYQRRLAALQEVSLAAATVLDPQELARVALDEIVRILGAERALLFLTEDDADELKPHLGRDAAGRDLPELTNYGSTLVDQVRRTREAVVMTGSEQGVALGSESVLVHGLRSIIVAPLQLKGRLLGVVYLDNRVAKGVFTEGDVDILAAVTHPIAASLETARTAQLERDVHVAQQQRDLADTLRGAVADVTATLDPEEVLTRLAGTLGRVLSTEMTYLLRLDDNSVTAVDIHDGATDEAGTMLGDADDRTLAALVHSETPAAGDAGDLPRPLARLVPAAHSWLTLPLTTRDRHVGLLLIASSAPDAYEDSQMKMAEALAAQGMIAYDNALMFRRIEQMATVDALTGVNNRGHFFELGAQQVAVAVRQNRPLAGVMLDIDHFKRINDTYGHGVGDEVIREVAGRLKQSLRNVDILGRYGGEEFAIVLPEVGDGLALIAERLRAVIAGSPIPTEAGPVPVTISVGTARPDGSSDTLDDLLGRADQALYQAKQAGRNRVVHG